jgi:hypothetical protein
LSAEDAAAFNEVWEMVREHFHDPHLRGLSYDTTHERRLRFVLRARELGFSLDEIRALLRLVDARDQPCAEVRAVAATHHVGGDGMDGLAALPVAARPSLVHLVRLADLPASRLLLVVVRV